MTFSSIFSILSHSPDQFFQLVNESLLDLNGNIWKKKKDSFFWVDEWNLLLEYVVLTFTVDEMAVACGKQFFFWHQSLKCE